MLTRKDVTKRLVYRNKYGMNMILGTADSTPSDLQLFDRGGETICFKLVGETDRAYIFHELEIPDPTPADIAEKEDPLDRVL